MPPYPCYSRRYVLHSASSQRVYISLNDQAPNVWIRNWHDNLTRRYAAFAPSKSRGRDFTS
ncbi:unnamed protein product [Protopolystoma xenopodis]|uniref:Uncharacterized protein n=1 Tax=Protopolystoma xenopodis TaxID=117903 RepID=A0A448XM27_9PLAT|nr:unnamed protein product [Protopolystoma xenopodis]